MRGIGGGGGRGDEHTNLITALRKKVQGGGRLKKGKRGEMLVKASCDSRGGRRLLVRARCRAK